METKNKLRAAMKFPLSSFIKEQMEYREWSISELSEATGMNSKDIDILLNDKQPISTDTATILEKVFGPSAQYWINLDTGFRKWLETSVDFKK